MRRSRVTAIVAVLVAVAIGLVAYRWFAGSAPPRNAAVAPTRGRAWVHEVRHQPPGSIAGAVSAGGSPVAGATVCAGPSELTQGRVACAATNDRGTYVIDGLPAAGYIVWASAPRLVGAPWPGRAPELDGLVRLDAGERVTGIDLVLLGGTVAVTGTVRDVRDRAIGGALIHVRTEHPTQVFSTRSAVDGTFEAWTSPGDVHVVASADGFVDGNADAQAPTDHVMLILSPAAVLAGIVLEVTSRRPLADVAVTVPDGETRTDAAGRFRLTKLRPGRYKPAATAIGGYGELGESVRLGLGETIENLVIEVYPVAVVVGHVVIEDGVSSVPCPSDEGGVMLSRYGSSATYHTRTAIEGAIILDGVVPGTYAVSAYCTHYVSALPYPDLVVGDSDVDDLAWPVHVGARLAGRVVTTDGAPVADVIVNHLSAGGTSIGSVVTHADGSFTADGVAPGKTEIRIRVDGYTGAKDPVYVDVTRDAVAYVTVVLDHTGGQLAGTVVDELGRPIADLRIRAKGPEETAHTTDALGAFAFDGLDPGSYELAADHDWGDPAHTVTRATVTDGQITRVRIVVTDTPTNSITGTVTDERGAPITHGEVEVSREAPDDGSAMRSRTWHSTRTPIEVTGGFRVTHLPPGRFTLRAQRTGGGEAVLEHVSPGDGARLVIRPTAVLAGVVVGSNGAAIDDVTLFADNRDRRVYREERLFHTGGKFVVRDLPAGTYRLTIDRDVRSATTVTLAEGELRDDIRLVAQPRFTIRGKLVAATTHAPLVGWKVDVPSLQGDEHFPDGRQLRVYTSEIAITGADGRFLIHNLPAGEATLSAGDVTRDPEIALSPVRTIVLGGPNQAALVELGDIEMVPAHE